jgi:membrane associated rhomboid family serine protease
MACLLVGSMSPRSQPPLPRHCRAHVPGCRGSDPDARWQPRGSGGGDRRSRERHPTRPEEEHVIPLSDGLRAQRFPIVNVGLIVANFAVWLFYELPHLNSSVYHASFYPCTVNGSCHGPEPWGVSWITAMFMHGSWDHILGNMLFLAIFGKNVEDAYGRLRYLAFYIAGGFAAMMLQTLMTLGFGSAAEARVPNLGASGAIAAVLGAYFILYPDSYVRTLVLVFVVRIPAWIFLGLWFLYQLVEANFGLFSSKANGGGVAFFAHVGGFVFGVIVTWLLLRAKQVEPRDAPRWSAFGARPIW